MNNIEELTSEINKWAYTVSDIMNNLFTIIFLFSIILMGYSKLTKTGHVLKHAFRTMIWTPVAYFIIQLFVIIMFTVQKNGMTLLTEIVTFLKYSSVMVTIGMSLIGLLFHLFYKLIRHPEFMRWSRRLWSGSLIILLATIFIPKLFG